MKRDRVSVLLFSRMTSAFALAALTLLNNVQICFASPEQQYAELLRSAKSHTQMMEPEKAIKDLTEAIRINPTYYRTYQLRSEAYRDLNLYDESVADMTRAISCSKNNIGLYRDRGYLKFKHGYYKEAVADYTKALSLDPNDDISLRARGRAYSCLNEYKAAAVDYKKSLQFKNKTALRLEIETRGLLGELYVKSKQDKEALEQFNYLITKFPDVSKGYYGRAEVYKLQGKADLAKRELDKAHEVDYALDPGLRNMR